MKDDVRCDAVGCIGTLKDGRLVSMALAAEAFAEDCARAAVVISPRSAPGTCAALLIDRDHWRAHGATSLSWNGKGFDVSVARPAGYERPWARGPEATASTTSRMRPASPDATPRVEDLEAGD